MINMPRDDDTRAVEHAIGRFVLDLGMIENILIQALAVLTDVPQAQAHFLLNKSAGGAKAQLLKDAVRAKGLDLRTSGLDKAIGAVHETMAFRNRLVHDAIGFHSNSETWILGQGSPDGDKYAGNARLALTPQDLTARSEAVWEAIAVISREVLVKVGGFKPMESPPAGTSSFNVSVERNLFHVG